MHTALCLLLGLAFALSAADAEPDSARIQRFTDAVAMFASGASVKTYEDSTTAMLDAAKGHPEVLAGLIKHYTPYYTGDVPVAGTEAHADASAGAVMWAAGVNRFADLIQPLLTDKSPPCVVYALAEAKGLKLYYALTEGGVFDRIVTPEQARNILRENGLLPKP